MVLNLQLIIAANYLLNLELCLCNCARAEYEINGECCPMCAPGNHVYRHCSEFISTTCVPCAYSTFISEPNTLLNCFSCAPCDSEQGLRVKTACTRITDTVCEPLEGFYCVSDDRGSCTQAVEHTNCSPGHYIKQKGTAHKNVECAKCTDTTYSDGSFDRCRQHTKCIDLGLREIDSGTTESDVKCGNSIRVSLIAGIAIVFIVVSTILMLLILFHKTLTRFQSQPEISVMAGPSLDPISTLRIS